MADAMIQYPQTDEERPIHEWTEDDIFALRGREESLRLELKAGALFDQSHDKVGEELSKEVSAFANAEGGLLVLGVREERTARKGPRVAGDPDGVPVEWTGLRIQQMIESNISPFLSGIRVRPVSVRGLVDRRVVLVTVPAGTTAYQARDRIYYGRSEYEAKALPDHEVRLRMARWQGPAAEVRAEVQRNRRWEEVHAAKLEDFRRTSMELAQTVQQQSIEIPEVPEEGEAPMHSALRMLTKHPGRVGAEDFLDRFYASEYVVNLSLLNVGEMSLRDAEVELIARCGPGFLVADHNPQPIAGCLVPPELDRPVEVVATHQLANLVNKNFPRLLPGKSIIAQKFWLLVPRGTNSATGRFTVQWTVCFDNARPRSGTIDLAIPDEER